jgi:hypothetical protein
MMNVLVALLLVVASVAAENTVRDLLQTAEIDRAASDTRSEELIQLIAIDPEWASANGFLRGAIIQATTPIPSMKSRLENK